MKTFAVMPSNIALIKYMGKGALGGQSGGSNLPVNASLSYTTPRFESYVEIEDIKEGSDDRWEAMSLEAVEKLYAAKTLKHDFLVRSSPLFNEKEAEKFLSFFKVLKALYKNEKNYVVRSYNGFPSSCGLASSASSFAALTLAAHRAFTGEERVSDLEKLSRLSQKGSGSSCRSYFEPWALWEKNGASKAPLMLELDHYVLVIEAEKKKVSSSEAHLRVQTSSNFEGRPDRARKRLDELMFVLEKDWPRAFEICWNEFWDMHALFETSRPPFSYMKPQSIAALDILRKFWDEEGTGPLVTMDAGANIHLLFRQEDEEVQEEVLRRVSHFKVL